MAHKPSSSDRIPNPNNGDATSTSHRNFKPSPRAIKVDGEAMETFSFNVSAAEAADLEHKSRIDSQSGPQAPKQLPRSENLPSTNTNHDGGSDPTSNFHIVTTAKPQRKSPSWVASLMLHAVLLLPLGFLTQSQQPTPNDNDITFSFEPTQSIEQPEVFEDIEFQPLEELDTVPTNLTSDIPDPGIAELTELSSDSTFQELSDEATISPVSIGDLGSLSNQNPHGSTGLGEGLVGEPLADFFGTKIEGNRIVFVLDNSGGMVTGELETLVAELLRTVESLNRKQYFYVIFYSDSLYPLFYPNAPQHFVKATDKNKQRLEQWLDSVELCTGNVVDDALAAATAIRPDVVYLLTDGDLDSTRDQRRIGFLLNSSARPFPIHTFGLGTGKTSTAAGKLKQVAAANNGTFRAVEVTPDAVALAKIKSRPYHNKTPGEIWGQKVGKRQY